MTEAQAIELIAERWAASWGPTPPYGFDNEAFRSLDPQWARVTVQHTTSMQLTHGPIGGRRFEYRGNIVVQLFGDVDAGRAGVSTLVEAVKVALDSQSLGGSPSVEPLTTYAATTRETQSKATEGKWYQLNVIVPFVYYAYR